MPDLKQALRDFVATSNSGKYADEATLLSKFPELSGYDVQALRDFVATSNSGKYKTEDEVFSKFPEFSIGATQQAVDLKKKDTTVLPSANGFSVYQAPKELTDEDYFTGSFGDVLRGFDKIVPLGLGEFIDDMSRAAASGYRQGTKQQESTKLFLSGAKSSPEEIEKFIETSKTAQQLPPSAEMQEYDRIYKKEGEGVWGVIKGFANNPRILPEVILSSAVTMATNTDALKAGASAIGTGAGIGAAAGAPAGGVGAIPGAIAGATTAVPYAFGLASSVVEIGATFAEGLEEQLEGKEMTKENVKAILEDSEKLQTLRNKAIARGAIIGTLDALTGKLASSVGAKVLSKSAAKSATGEATKAAVTKSTAIGSAIEAVGGSAGEATARAATGQKMDISEIALEGIGELPGGIRSTIQARFSKPSYKVNGENVSAEEVDNLTSTMTPSQLADTKIEIKNDYEGREFKIQDKIVTNSIKEDVRKANPELNEPSLNAITQLEKDLRSLEGNTTQTGKDKAAAIRGQIKNIQENQLQEEAVAETVVADTSISETPELAQKRTERIAELEDLLTPDAYLMPIEKREELQTELETLKTEQDAIQIETAGQVPVQSETGISQALEGGEPQAEPQVIAEEVVQEEITAEQKEKEDIYKNIIDREFSNMGDLTLDKIPNNKIVNLSSVGNERKNVSRHNEIIKTVAKLNKLIKCR